jgi:uncharacterized membrane protein (DUF485 family)
MVLEPTPSDVLAKIMKKGSKSALDNFEKLRVGFWNIVLQNQSATPAEPASIDEKLYLLDYVEATVTAKKNYMSYFVNWSTFVVAVFAFLVAWLSLLVPQPIEEASCSSFALFVVMGGFVALLVIRLIYFSRKSTAYEQILVICQRERANLQAQREPQQ